MGIKIKPGHSANAAQELFCYIAAFPINQIGIEDDVILYWLPAGREDDYNMFCDMQENSVIGTFDVVSYMLR